MFTTRLKRLEIFGSSVQLQCFINSVFSTCVIYNEMLSWDVKVGIASTTYF